MREFENTRNPILPPDIHIPDGEAHVMPDGKLYIYGSFDALQNEYCSDRYYPVSTPDMRHWTVHDPALTVRDIPWADDPDRPRFPGIDWKHPTPFILKMLEASEAKDSGQGAAPEADVPKTKLLFAPDCAWHDGKYILYFCLDDDSEGAAVSDRPEGPFVNPVQLPCGGIDPAIFVDDDGQAYYYWGQLSANGVKLNPDMISFDPAQVRHGLVTEEDHFFHEGSSMRKIGDTYYFVFSDMERGRPTALGYATGPSPLGPFVYQGIIIDNADCDPASWNNHGSIECFRGQWYVFYHRSSRGTKIHRWLCAEPITIGPDGRIAEVPMTSQGVGAPFAPAEVILGSQACGLKGSACIAPDDACGESLQNISDGDEAIFRYVESAAAWTRADIRGSGSGTMQIYLNDVLVGAVTLGESGAASAAISAPAGKYEVRLRFSAVHDLKIYALALS